MDTLYWCEPYYSERVLHQPKKMVVRRVKVWAKSGLRQNFPEAIFQIVLNRFCNTSYKIILSSVVAYSASF